MPHNNIPETSVNLPKIPGVKVCRSTVSWVLAMSLLATVAIAQKSKDTAVVYFENNQAKLSKKAQSSLDSFAKEVLSAKTRYSINLSGYCDATGSNSYNKKLSSQRNLAVKTYLMSKGLRSFWPPQSFGKTRPCNANRTEAERQANRRVEITADYPLRYYETHADTMRQFNAYLDTAKPGTHLILPGINFYPGLHRLLPRCLPIADSLVSILKKKPNLKVRIEGHVCCTDNGMDGEDNETITYDLSIHRAEAVYQYLVLHGIDPHRLSYMGRAGKHHLVDPEITDADKEKNRRVEVVVISR